MPGAEGIVVHSQALSRPRNEEINQEIAWGQVSGQGIR